MKLWGKDIPPNSREVSLLAIVETVAASALALWIAFGLGHLKWLALYVCLAPLLLLRTRYSTRLGLRWFGLTHDKIRRALNALLDWCLRRASKPLRALNPLMDVSLSLFLRTLLDAVLCLLVFVLLGLAVVGVAVSLVISAIAIKVTATVLSIGRHPLHAWLAVPRNWLAQAFKTDITCSPELLPGVARLALKMDKPLFVTSCSAWSGIQDVLSATTVEDRVIFGLVSSPLLAGSILLGLTYRWCLKATALVYLPLVFSVRFIFSKGDTLRARLGELLDTQLSKLQRIYTGFVLVFTGVIPFVVVSHYSALCTALAQKFPAGEPVFRYWLVFDMQLKMWHIAGLLGAALTWWLYFKADQLRVKMQNGGLAEQREQKQALRGLQALMVARAGCSAYTIFCGVVAFAKTQSWVTLNVLWVP